MSGLSSEESVSYRPISLIVGSRLFEGIKIFLSWFVLSFACFIMALRTRVQVWVVLYGCNGGDSFGSSQQVKGQWT